MNPSRYQELLAALAASLVAVPLAHFLALHSNLSRQEWLLVEILWVVVSIRFLNGRKKNGGNGP